MWKKSVWTLKVVVVLYVEAGDRWEITVGACNTLFNSSGLEEVTEGTLTC